MAEERFRKKTVGGVSDADARSYTVCYRAAAQHRGRRPSHNGILGKADRRMHVAFLYNESSEDPGLAAEEPNPAQSPIVAALHRLGHRVTRISCTLDLSAVRRRLERSRPDVVFNRVESLGGSDAMMAAIPLLLETIQLPYTGCSGAALAATASKTAVKDKLVRAGLLTPPWITTDEARHGRGRTSASSVEPGGPGSRATNAKYIIKSVYEHASFRLDDSSIVEADNLEAVVRFLRRREVDFGRPLFAEQFIDGREFNLSILGHELQILPPAEIDFCEFPAGKPRIVGHSAKCDPSSFEFHHTPRRFDFPPSDAALLRRLAELTSECAEVFNLNGYARIDFRCDAAGEPWILEINANPCLSPTSGFPAALARAGYRYDDAIQRLLDDAWQPPSALRRAKSNRSPRVCRPASAPGS